ncbi:MAG: 3'-5' exonuclease [Planctomycetes bacterium]|jgi:DNA polymerase-3 subunit epsilon|nr:3'-5' exonuclease [Planctomycetota bacterium]
MFFRSDKYQKIMKMLKLDKPLIVFDIETTGLMISSDKIVELAYVKTWPDGRTKRDRMLINPEMEITPEASAVHSIKNVDVEQEPPFRARAQEFWEIFHDCYYAGHNVLSFDLPLLRREFVRAGMDFVYKIEQIIDTRVIFQRMVKRSLSATYEYYCRKRLTQEHTAQSDLEAAADILYHQLEKYKETRDLEFLKEAHKNFGGEEPADMTRKFYWREGEAYFSFSKYKDERLSKVAREDPEFLKWILESDFPGEIKSIIKKALKKTGF